MYVCMYVCVYVCLFVGCCVATKSLNLSGRGGGDIGCDSRLLGVTFNK